MVDFFITFYIVHLQRFHLHLKKVQYMNIFTFTYYFEP